MPNKKHRRKYQCFMKYYNQTLFTIAAREGYQADTACFPALH